MALPAILAGAGAASSLVSDIIGASDIKKNKRRAYDAYAKLLRSNTEILTRADRAGDNFYTKAMGELNEGAFAARGALNPGMLKTIAYAKMAAGRSGVEAQSEMTDEGFNDSIRGQMAAIEATPEPSVNPINAITAGAEGYLAGEQLNMTKDLMGKQGKYLDALTKDIGKNPLSMIPNPIFNNLIKKKKYSQYNRGAKTPVNPSDIFDLLG